MENWSYDATCLEHVLHMNTFNSAINQPFYNYSSTLKQQFISTEQNRVHARSAKTSDTFQSDPQQNIASCEMSVRTLFGRLTGF